MKSKIQSGQKYRTRNRCTATILEIDEVPGEMRIITARIDGDHHLGQPVTPYTRNYTEEGREYLSIGKQVQEDSPYDLIAPAQ